MLGVRLRIRTPDLRYGRVVHHSCSIASGGPVIDRMLRREPAVLWLCLSIHGCSVIMAPVHALRETRKAEEATGAAVCGSRCRGENRAWHSLILGTTPTVSRSSTHSSS